MTIDNLFKYLNSKNRNNKIQLIYHTNPDFNLLMKIDNSFKYLNFKTRNNRIQKIYYNNSDFLIY